MVFRPTLPNVPAGASTNEAGSYQREGVRFAAYPLPMPVYEGRSVPWLPVLALSTPPMVSVCGTPLWIVIPALNSQPPNNVLAAEFWMFQRFPLPAGSSYTPPSTSRCRVSKDD